VRTTIGKNGKKVQIKTRNKVKKKVKKKNGNGNRMETTCYGASKDSSEQSITTQSL
jgi:hypothetical protein